MNPPKPIFIKDIDPDTLLEMQIILSKEPHHFHPVFTPKPVYVMPQVKEKK